MKRNIFIVTLLIIIAALSRFIPHGYNFTPIAGMALLGGAYFGRKVLAFVVPISVLFITDVILNNTLYRAFFSGEDGFVLFSDFMIYTYAGTAAIVLIGMGLLKKVTGPRILGGALLSTIVFFLITNFGFWIGSPMYPQNGAGLLAAYVAGLPFMSGHLLANVVFSFLLFGSYELATKQKFTGVFKLS